MTDKKLLEMKAKRENLRLQAVAILNKAAGEYFNPAIVDKFNQNVAIYPMGKTVRLSNEQTGMILGVGINSKTTPVVRILSSPEGHHINRIVELDLRKNSDLFIVDFEELYSSYAQAYAASYIYQPKGGTYGEATC